jgi:ribosomal protein L21
MYDICSLGGGRQVKAEPARTIRIDYRKDSKKVHATIVEHGRDAKIVVYRKIRRKEYHKMRGHHQYFTKIKVDKIEG